MTDVIQLQDGHDNKTRTLHSVRIGLIVQQVTHCDTDTRTRISDDIDDRYRIHPPQDVLLFAHPATRRWHAVALLGVAEIIQRHTRVNDARTLEVLAVIADQYTFTPRHQEEAA